MVFSKVARIGEPDQGRVSHQIADPAMQMSRGRVNVLPVLDPDQVGHFGRIEQTAIPAGERASATGRGEILLVLLWGQSLQALVHIILVPGQPASLVQPKTEWLCAKQEWRRPRYGMPGGVNGTD